MPNTTSLQSNSTNDQLFLYQKNLFNDLNEYNKLYVCYARRKYNQDKNKDILSVDDYPFPCEGTTTKLKEDLNDMLYGAGGSHDEVKKLRSNGNFSIMHQVGEMKDFFKSHKRSNIPTSVENTQQMHDDILTKHRNIDILRNELETKLKELNTGDGSHSKESKMQLDATVYASLLWSTLATCLIYYTVTAT